MVAPLLTHSPSDQFPLLPQRQYIRRVYFAPQRVATASILDDQGPGASRRRRRRSVAYRGAALPAAADHSEKKIENRLPKFRVVHTRACVVQTPPLSTSTYSVGTIAWCLRVSDCTASIPRRALSVLPQRRAMRSRSSVRTRWLWRMIAWIGLSTAAIARNHRWCGSGSSRATTRSPSHGTVCWASPSQGARESWAMRRVKD